MKLHPPFAISARLRPALRIGDAWLSLEYVERRTRLDDPRQRACLVLDFDDGECHVDQSLRSGIVGFGSTVAIFESYLSFLEAAADSLEYEIHTGRKGDNVDLFPMRVVEWALDHKSEIELVRCQITDPDDGRPNVTLIEE